MPDAAGNFKGQGWSAKRASGWERAFGQQPLCPHIGIRGFKLPERLRDKPPDKP